MSVTFSPAAVRDLEEFGDYIHAEHPAVAARFIAALRIQCEKLDAAPRSGKSRPEIAGGLRSVPFRRYVVFYSLEHNAVCIERILHGAHDITAEFSDDPLSN